MQRRSDGTLSVQGVRYEIPSQYRHLPRIHIRLASWDLSHVHLVDPISGTVLCRLYPQDKQRNADGRRRSKVPLIASDRAMAPAATGDTMAPLLRKLVANYAATGMPPAYLPKDECKNEDDHERNVKHE
jgi:hypothetical protein